MPLGEVIAEFIGEVFAQGFLEGLASLLRRLGALVRSLVIPGLSYPAALRRSWNGLIGIVVLLLVGLAIAVIV